jgi:hypothetical protein
MSICTCYMSDNLVVGFQSAKTSSEPVICALQFAIGYESSLLISWVVDGKVCTQIVLAN